MLIALSILFLSLFPPPPASSSPILEGYSSPLIVRADPSGERLFVTVADGLRIIDPLAFKTISSIHLPEPPTGLAFSLDGSRAYVTSGVSRGRVSVVDIDEARVINEIPVDHAPLAPVAGPLGKRLFLLNRFEHTLSVIDLESGALEAKIPVGREPVDQVLTHDGRTLLVANLLPSGPADGIFAAASVSVIDTAALKTVADITLLNGATSVRGICLSPDGKFAYLTHILARYPLPTTQLERGWMNTNALSVLDVANRSLKNTVLLDDVDLGAANPWGVACSLDGRWLIVAHAGTHELSVIDRAGLHERLDRAERGERVTPVSTDLGFLKGLRNRIALPGQGPRSVAVAKDRAFAAQYFSRTLASVALEPGSGEDPLSLALGEEWPMTRERRGEALFNDATLCFQHWQSCESCHPDGRTDGLNWDLLNDGMGNPRSTKSLLLSHQTPPAMITGVRDRAETAVRAGLRYILFAKRPEEEAEAVDAFLKSLKPVPSPYLVDGELSDKAHRGKKLFEAVGCAKCHPAPLYTDLRLYDVGTGKGADRARAFDVPTLIEVWRTAPYLYDGRAATIEEVLTRFNLHDSHGKTSVLSPDDIKALAEFVLSL